MNKYADVYEPSLEIDPGVKAVYQTAHASAPFDPTARVEHLMQGAIDIHCHCGPCALVKRTFDEVQYGIEATRAGMAAIVNKGLTFPTARSAVLAQSIVYQWAKEQDLQSAKIIGGVTLGYSIGGLNAEAVRTSARYGGKVVWTPAIDSAHHRRVEALAGMDSKGGIEVIDTDGDVVPELMEIFGVVAKNDMLLSLAHHSTRERFAMIDAAKEVGVRRISIIHPFQRLTKMTIPQMKIATDKGAYIEHLFFDLSPYSWDWDETMEAIRQLGPDHICLGTDGGDGLCPLLCPHSAL